MATRRGFLSLSAVALAGVAGCTSKVTKPTEVGVENPHAAYEVDDLSSWTAGSGFERGATLIVDGTLTVTSETPRTPPKIEGEFTDSEGQTETVVADYEEGPRWTAYEEHRTREFESGGTVSFRLFYEPDERTSVREATVYVRAEPSGSENGSRE
ncbi:DUF3426 domain-containing protein [Halorientalis salina]|uniref:DUF3426 domain-containing protein n=1 Tax=Halorientalis salina TaxID=2932266 RepID=UPI0010AB6111|nr:DUF3426 domain-containing protein [Halorientalis salina]